MATSADVASLLGLGNIGNSSSVGSGSDITNFQKEIAASDPYAEAINTLNSIKLNPVTQLPGGQTYRWTPLQTGASLGVQAFLSSFLKELGQADTQKQMTAAAMAYPSLLKDPAGTPLPDGVDPGAFSALRMSVLNKQENTNEAIRQALGIKGITLNPDGSESVTPGAADAISSIFTAENTAKRPPMDLTNADPRFVQAMKDAGGDHVLARQLMKSQLAAQPTLGALSNSISVIKELENLKNFPQTFSGGPSDYLDGAGNAIAAIIAPGSNSATYNSKVIPLTDSLLRALTQVGRGSQYTQSQIKNDLSDAWGKGPEALAARARNYQEDLLAGAQQKASDLVQGGYLGAHPVLDQINNLDLNNLSGGPSPSGAPPMTQEIYNALKAQGHSQADIEAMYAGGGANDGGEVSGSGGGF